MKENKEIKYPKKICFLNAILLCRIPLSSEITNTRKYLDTILPLLLGLLKKKSRIKSELFRRPTEEALSIKVLP
jgi:hypothetical protein